MFSSASSSPFWRREPKRQERTRHRRASASEGGANAKHIGCECERRWSKCKARRLIERPKQFYGDGERREEDGGGEKGRK
eukprot:1619541-Rhodomonas_salina.1